MIPRSGNYLVDMWEDEEEAQSKKKEEKKYGKDDARLGWDEVCVIV